MESRRIVGPSTHSRASALPRIYEPAAVCSCILMMKSGLALSLSNHKAKRLMGFLRQQGEHAQTHNGRHLVYVM